MKDLFIQLAKRGKTILLCSHLLADVEDVCDRIGILFGGRMQLEGQVKSLLQHSDEKQILTGPISDDAIEQIKRIIQAEHTKCEITSPMDRLEEFFIKTVATAQEKKLPTSGAVSTTEIGGFLAEGTDTANILDKLVSASLTPADSQRPSLQTTQTDAAKTQPEPEQDTDLLEKLIKTAAEPAPTDTARTTQPVETELPDYDTVKKDILDELTGRSSTDDGSTEQASPPQPGETDNA
jgi:ABC-2 type transport system ATP-binding protein